MDGASGHISIHRGKSLPPGFPPLRCKLKAEGVDQKGRPCGVGRQKMKEAGMEGEASENGGERVLVVKGRHSDEIFT
ncbi:hypothetical protein H6P81_015254 [Aristolochia fimbriata]|uniref:Uncharacterized protein n=1 Tax=Aristolochia fimbriata TaxID=158543 RepID=A0AAV7E547_ARIFI|nr:hypothetical protein H6P81_015254 [Aristolochia fimbriata]